MKCRFEWRSTRKSILPPLMSLTACATFGVTVPVRGFGIKFRGPRILPRRPTRPIMSGDATAATTYARWGGELLLEHGSEVTRVEAIRSLAEAEGSGTLGLAWEASPEDPRFGSEAAAVL